MREEIGKRVIVWLIVISFSLVSSMGDRIANILVSLFSSFGKWNSKNLKTEYLVQANLPSNYGYFAPGNIEKKKKKKKKKRKLLTQKQISNGYNEIQNQGIKVD